MAQRAPLSHCKQHHTIYMKQLMEEYHTSRTHESLQKNRITIIPTGTRYLSSTESFRCFFVPGLHEASSRPCSSEPKERTCQGPNVKILKINNLPETNILIHFAPKINTLEDDRFLLGQFGPIFTCKLAHGRFFQGTIHRGIANTPDRRKWEDSQEVFSSCWLVEI